MQPTEETQVPRPNDVASSYKPQFSSSTSLILSRLRAPATAAVAKPPSRPVVDVSSAESGQKRKRPGEEDEEGQRGQVPSLAATRDCQPPSRSPLAEITVGGAGAGASGVPAPPAAAYNPEAVEAVEPVRSRLQNNIQQLAAASRQSPRVRCEKCARALSPLFNQLVLCSRCRAAWHQLCHEPEIDNAVVQQPGAVWSCARCAAGLKRIKIVHSGKNASQPDLKKTLPIALTTASSVADGARVSWPGCSAGQKRAYFATLSGSELIRLLMRSTELHPDLPLFPPSIVRGPADAAAKILAASRAAGLPQTGAYRNGIINSIRKSSSSAKIRLAGQNSKDGKGKDKDKDKDKDTRPASTPKSTSPAKPVLGTQIDPDEEDPTGLMDAWPRPGQGLYATLAPEWEDDLLIDHGDSGAFSHSVYGHHGHKIQANGIILHVQ